MEKKSNESTQQGPNGDRVTDAALVKLDLPFFIKQIKEETAWKDGKRAAITLLKSPGLRIVLIALHAGAEMARHTADGMISVQLLEGSIQFNTDQDSVELAIGQMLVLHEHIPHSVKAIPDSIFMLTVATAAADRPGHL